MTDETPGKKRRPVPHPLLSAPIGTLLGCFREYGWPDVRFRYWVRAFSLLCVCTIRTPLHHLEAWRVRQRVDRQELAAPPVFIIGHWRSGTTHLHQLLCQDPQFGFVTLMEAAFPLDFLTSIGKPLLAALLPARRPMDAVTVNVDSPWEEEMAMACFGAFSFFHVFFFPRSGRRAYRAAVHFDGLTPPAIDAWWRDYRLFLKKVQCAKSGRRLLLKNPANSARVAALRERFPGAKFIHIHRHPEEVYASTILLHRKLQEAWALQACDRERLPQIVLKNYRELMAACLEQTRDLPASELIEVSMLDLEANPLQLLRSVYEQLELPGFEAASGRFEIYLDRLGRFPKNRLTLDPAERQAVQHSLRFVYERWGYRPLSCPAAAQEPKQTVRTP